jgi:hypothetical protein
VDDKLLLLLLLYLLLTDTLHSSPFHQFASFLNWQMPLLGESWLELLVHNL